MSTGSEHFAETVRSLGNGRYEIRGEVHLSECLLIEHPDHSHGCTCMDWYPE